MKRLYIQIPTYLVRNEGVNLTATDFALLCLLKHAAFTNGQLELSFDHTELKVALKLRDSRAFKQSLKNLYVAGVINTDVQTLPRKGPLQIELSQDAMSRKPFTQLPAKVLTHIGTVGHIGLRLLYYYESYINRSKPKNQFCFSAFKTIAEKLDISQMTVHKYNALLVLSGMLTITKAVISTDYSYDDIGYLAFTRWNNHYTPITDKI